MQRRFGKQVFDFATEYAIMAIINRTPDSFYDHGRTNGLSKALGAAQEAIEQGARWIDVGGVTAFPGQDVDEAEEVARVVPLVTALRTLTTAVISIDTYRASVARRALAAGADVVNDVSGLADLEIADAAAEADAGLVIMHTLGPPRLHPPRRPKYDDVILETKEFLGRRIDMALERGVHAERLIIDPGYDFHKDTEHSLELIRRLDLFRELGYPILVALSNKAFIGDVLDVPPHERIEGSIAAAVTAVLAGGNIVRTHNVVPMVRALRMVEAILGWRQPLVRRDWSRPTLGGSSSG